MAALYITLAWPRLALISQHIDAEACWFKKMEKEHFHDGAAKLPVWAFLLFDSNKINEYSHLGGAVNITLKLVFKYC